MLQSQLNEIVAHYYYTIYRK